MKAMPTKTCLLLLSALSLSAQAELKPMDDASMEDTVGQAYIRMDSTTTTGVNTGTETQFSRVTFGQTVKVQTNIDTVILGDLGPGLVDISAQNFSLGHINSTGDIVPFTFKNPYIEWATDATNNITGFRVGAEDTKGVLQADWSSFSGHIDMKVNDVAASLFNVNDGTKTNNRATHIGDSTGTCTGTADCIGLDSIKSLSVGDPSSANDSNDVAVTGTADFFLSFQKTALDWDLATPGIQRAATKGFFMNIPTNNDISTSGAGTLGYTVEFIDRGIGRWH